MSLALPILHVFNPRMLNPLSRRTKIVLGVVTALGVGATIFFTTRRAAAASSAKSAFSVSPDCMEIVVVDESAARAAATAAALVVRPTPSDNALAVAISALSVALPQCDWSEIPPDRTFVHGTSRYRWSQIEDLLGDKTVAQLSQMASAGPSFVASPVPRLVNWLLYPPFIIDPPRGSIA